jgi:hypothetical protein
MGNGSRATRAARLGLVLYHGESDQRESEGYFPPSLQMG